jgi:hypothetical protein
MCMVARSDMLDLCNARVLYGGVGPVQAIRYFCLLKRYIRPHSRLLRTVAFMFVLLGRVLGM